MEVKAPLVALCRLLYSRALVLALHGVTAGREDSEYGFVKDILAERLIHLACRQVANVCGEAALDTVERVRWLGVLG